jgi:hypothetical protein
LIGEKFRAALGIAAPVDVAALAVQPIELIKRIAAAANIVNVSFRMGSPIRFGVLRISVRSISLLAFPNNRPSNPARWSLVFFKRSSNLSLRLLNQPARSIDPSGCGREWTVMGESDEAVAA